MSSKESVRRLFDAALADHRAGRLDAAKAKYGEVLRHDPKHADSLHLSGQIAFAQGAADQAIQLINAALAQNRRNPHYHDTLASILNRMGRASEAEASARSALALSQSNPVTFVNLGLALNAQGRLPEARAAFERALALSPDDLAAIMNLGAILLKIGQTDESERRFRRATQLQPQNAVAWANLAEALRELERGEEAAAAARRALALNPEHAPAHATLGVVQLEAGAVADAIASYRQALALRPSEAQYLGNLANAHLAAGDGTAALAAYERFLAVAPNDPKTIYNRGISRLTLGNLAEGLEDYEARWAGGGASFIWRASDKPLWDAASPTDIRLLVWGEQGVGDHLLHASCLRALAGLGVRVIFECDPRLAPLLARSLPEIAVARAGEAVPEHDYHVPVGSLLRILRTKLGEWIPERRWLAPDSARVQEFRARLAALGPGRKIGLSWRSARKIVGPHKSLPLDRWGPILATPGVTFVNLQYGDTDAETAAAQSTSGAVIYTDPTLDRFDDLDGLAALIDALDLVLTTSNVTAHLAGALGKEGWIALQKVPLWYWGMSGERSLFYPSLRLIRQTALGDWVPVVAEMTSALSDR